MKLPGWLVPGRPAADNPVGARRPPAASAAGPAGRAGTSSRGTAAAPLYPASVGPRAKAVLFIAFAFAIMADPVSSVAYTIEASLRALHGYLGLLMATQIIVLGIILLVDVNYWQLVGRFPMGGGSAEGAARAFGTGWVFVPIGALIVDFVLTITISVAAGVSAVIAYLPSLAPARIVLGLGLLVLVAGLTWFGHGGRLTFAVMTLLFVASAVAVLAHGSPIPPWATAPRRSPAPKVTRCSPWCSRFRWRWRWPRVPRPRRPPSRSWASSAPPTGAGSLAAPWWRRSSSLRG